MRTFSVSFFIGTLVLLFLPRLPSVSTQLGLGALALTVLVSLWFLRRRYSRGSFVLLVLTGVFLGGFYAIGIATQVRGQWLPTAWEGQDVLLTGTIADVPEQRLDGLRFLFDVDHPQFHGRLRLAWYAENTPELRAGERWQLLVRGKRPHGFSNRNGFDYEQWLFAQRIGGTGYVRVASDNRRLRENAWWQPNGWRQTVRDAIQSALPDSPTMGLVQGLAVAYTAAIPQQQWKVFRDTGTVHLLAISGLHITMVAGLGIIPVWLLWRLFPVLYLWMPRRIAAGVVGGILASGYALLAGFNIPTQRTLLMLLVVLAGLLWRRHIPFSMTLAVALLLVLLLDSLAPLTVGFWLSFLSVGLLASLGMRQWRVGKSTVVWVQLVLSIGLLPLTAGFFGMVSLGAPLANLLAIPLVTFVVTPLVLLGILVFTVMPGLAASVWSVAAELLEGLLWALEWVAAIPFSAVAVPLVPLVWLVVALLGFGLLCLPRGMPGRWLGGVLLLPMFLYQPPLPDWGAFRLTVLDVGQGLASVVQTARHTLVFDTGPKTSDSFDTGELVLLPWLQGQGIRHVDRLVLSHSDNDHQGGAQALLRGLPVTDVLVGMSNSLPEYATTLCERGQRWEWDGIQFAVLHPSPDFTDPRDNNRSCVIKISNAHHSVLLTADIERAVEQWLIKQGSDLETEVLLVPHHGSKTSSSPAFIDAVSPAVGVVTSGYLNRFNHPHSAVVERYAARQITLLNTVDSGELRFDFPVDARLFTVKKWREETPRLWHKAVP